ncbi:hypothetical protein A2422_04190 [Candidatus Woesebacteria bacterium RIFOXYC1_FULL_31_51]|uniref:Uncharacterized protein n=1 Tax=Candidatus Woesebacteria bacterium GW2011_GWC2_31_9 TaxID=1618586 RepID=A0A0F9YM25_9BACT|nr:MAG: hypothetical protein UR17_C0001G0596 [Candidatus Woesebacteria bacterium GW2011_GWF1_31_35]KKP22790.1 MAG: hypothetical protein UR11_C0002G0170 [Candidatus Woesebacteria bacterium GW2011_GWC1_30_29]KKP26722.1 MAG: hypothetical protein UR13_C0003G0089 [Candidatus Woesebacteria bacterium GW2011_GWD1_31_12]KKP28038.1 MAG: hypothetical protein UR16_C0001G0059 [Candidatus Woesebacteria bacterium GW2011_GWB1_31_29]KKP32293.1 MAG: hypothetical protein UR21_C0001G0089 [Candidatus Woesebacteria 
MNTTAQSFKQAIKKSARTIGDEPLEILKNARDQVTGSEDYFSGNEKTNEVSKDDSAIRDEEQYKKKVSEQDGRHLEALEVELKDIRRQKLFNEIMQKIQDGIDVSVEEFSELTYEQREVLKAQIEVIKNKKIQSLNQNNGLIEPASKKGRRLGIFGQKQAAEKQTTRVENPIQSST